jgi:hypothetical protein
MMGKLRVGSNLTNFKLYQIELENIPNLLSFTTDIPGFGDLASLSYLLK